jgi:hypothetical protein
VKCIQINSINGVKWENVTNERLGDVSSFLCVNHRAIYNSMWNTVAEAAKIEIVPTVVEKIKRLSFEPDLTKVLVTNIGST